ncbi:MAG TPA: methyltransferase domain-containing protein [Anaerolineales bacterium]|nr:methyltransferase domain-containing protein [Anaerolineales bacterium]
MKNPLAFLIDTTRVTADGERVTHLWPNDCYYAHLSIYHFGRQYCQNKLILDAGSGAGYGSAYLADHGARLVEAVDVSGEAVRFSRKYFKRSNLRYQVMSLEQIQGFAPQSFDFIFSSNVLEHVPDVIKFFTSAYSLLTPGGVLLAAVPPVIDENSKQANLQNIFHLNIWSPRQWQHVLSMFFEEIEYYVHRFEKPGISLDFSNTPEQTIITESDFTFTATALDEYDANCLTAVFVARKPKSDLPEVRLDFVDDSFTRPVHKPTAGQAAPSINIILRAWKITREQGVSKLIKKSIHYLRHYS